MPRGSGISGGRSISSREARPRAPLVKREGQDNVPKKEEPSDDEKEIKPEGSRPKKKQRTAETRAEEDSEARIERLNRLRDECMCDDRSKRRVRGKYSFDCVILIIEEDRFGNVRREYPGTVHKFKPKVKCPEFNAFAKKILKRTVGETDLVQWGISIRGSSQKDYDGWVVLDCFSFNAMAQATTNEDGVAMILKIEYTKP